MMIFLPIVGIYLMVGLVYGMTHASSIIKLVREVGQKEEALRANVATYDMTSRGATYYAELQDLHITRAAWLEEYQQYIKAPGKYEAVHYLYGFALWPYYLLTVSKINKQSKRVGR